MNSSEFYFYIGQVFSASFILGAAYFSFKMERSKNRWGILFCSIGLTFVNYCVAYKANKDAVRGDDTAKFYRDRYIGLMQRGLDSSHKIIDTLDSTIIHSRKLVSSTNDIIASQNKGLKDLDNQIKISSSIQHSLTNSTKKLYNRIEVSSNSVMNQLSDENRYVFFDLRKIGRKEYVWELINVFKSPVFIHNASIFRYDDLLKCRIIDQKPLPKIDKSCFENALFGLTRFKVPPFIMSTGAIDCDEFPINLNAGLHRYLIGFTVRNRSYQQQIVYLIENNNNSINILQSSRLTSLDGSKVIEVFPSIDNDFNKTIIWNNLFPIPPKLIDYKME